MNNRTIGIIIASVIVIFAFLAVIYKLTNSSPSTTSPDTYTILPTDHIKWSPDKKNILIEYSDFQCPGCKNIHDLLKQFEATSSPDFKITQKVTFIFRHFPFHPNSYDAAYAAEAAGKQGKFYEMADLLFNSRDEWSKMSDAKEYFIKLASGLKLDINQFKIDVNSKEIKNKVANDFSSGDKAGINETPTFFLNGEKLDRITSFDEFKKLLLNL